MIASAPPLLISERALDAESRVLAAALFIDGEAGRIVAAAGGRMLFTDPFRAAAWRVARDAFAAGTSCDWSAIGERLIREGTFSPQRVNDELIALESLSLVAHRHAVDAALNELHERANAAEIERECREIANGNVSPIEARSRLTTIIDSQARHAGAQRLTLADTLQVDPADEPVDTIRTGIPGFDAILPNGGLAYGDKVAMAGLPGAGKSALALTITLSALITNHDLQAVWALGEMSVRTLRNRALQTLSGLTIGVLRRGWDELSPLQTEAKRSAVETLREIGKRLTIVESPLTPGRIETAVASTGARLLVVDYIQLLRLDGAAPQSRRDEIDGVVRALTSIANRRGCASIWLSSMPKTAMTIKDIYTCFKESSEIAHAVDLAFLLDPLGDGDVSTADAPDVLDIRLSCLKSRNGSPLSALLRFDRPAQRFTFETGGRA